MNLKDCIRTIPDFPKPGILFYDISTLLANPAAWAEAVNRLALAAAARKPQVLAAIEARGFFVAAALGLKMGLGVVMLRKQGKLPGKTIAHDYSLEYGTATLEVQEDAFRQGTCSVEGPAGLKAVEAGGKPRVLIVDDLLGTGGTLNAAVELTRKAGGDVRGALCLMELSFLNGRKRVETEVDSLLVYDS